MPFPRFSGKSAPGLRITVSASVFTEEFYAIRRVTQVQNEGIARRRHPLRHALAKIKGVEVKSRAMNPSYIEAAFARDARQH